MRFDEFGWTPQEMTKTVLDAGVIVADDDKLDQDTTLVLFLAHRIHTGTTADSNPGDEDDHNNPDDDNDNNNNDKHNDHNPDKATDDPISNLTVARSEVWD